MCLKYLIRHSRSFALTLDASTPWQKILTLLHRDDGSCIVGDPCANELAVTFDGYTYDLVAIGDQCWFAENLRTEHYTNGDSIPANLPNDSWQWLTTTSGAVRCTEKIQIAIIPHPTATRATPPGRSTNTAACTIGTRWTTSAACARGLARAHGWGVDGFGRLLGWERVSLESHMKSAYGWYDGGNGTNSSGFSRFAWGGARFAWILHECWIRGIVVE